MDNTLYLVYCLTLLAIIGISLYQTPREGFLVGTPLPPNENPNIADYSQSPPEDNGSYPQRVHTGVTRSEGYPYRRPEHLGYRWTESWRPYYWKNYPEPPIWYPARNPAGDQPPLPPDPQMLQMMERSQECTGPANDHKKCQGRRLADQGVSPQGYRYFWRLDQPKSALCSDFANQTSRNQPYPHFNFRRAYAKCINGVL
jgi:hypothetical protein